MRKLCCILLCLAMGALLFAGCSNQGTADNEQAPGESTAPETAATADETVTLKLGIWPEDSLTDDIAMHEAWVEEFEATHPNVEVVPDYYKYATDTFVSLAESGNLPTIFETWYTEPQKLIAAGFVADITDELTARGWLDAINPSIKDLLSSDGRTYGIPRDGYALGLMLNVEQFEAAGLVDDNGYPMYPKTWEELATTAKAIKDATGEAGLCLLAKDNAGGWHFSNIAWCFGATLCTQNDDGTFTANLNSPEAVAAMQYVKDLKWEYDVLTPDPTNEDWGTGFVNLGTGAAAMYIAANDAVNQPTQINGLPVDKLSLVPMPAGPGGDQYSLSGGTPYMFSKDATEAEINAALDYLIIMGKAPVATDEAVEGMRTDAQNKVDNGVPVIPRFPAWINQDLIDAENAVTAEFSNVDMNLFNDYYDALKTPGNLHLESPGLTQDMYAELTKVLQAVVTDKDADVQALMVTAQANYQAMLDNQ
jgi:multiple sugar transport system substrate-binding protein